MLVAYKMGKTQRKHGMVTIYIKPEFRNDFETFIKLIDKDERLEQLRHKSRAGLISIAIIQLIERYIQEREELEDGIIKEDNNIENNIEEGN